MGLKRRTYPDDRDYDSYDRKANTELKLNVIE